MPTDRPISSPGGDSLSPTQKARAIKRAYQAELMSKANVVGVGVGYRYQQGKPTGTLALVVMVRRKVPRHELAPQDILPTEIEGIPVDVREVGEVRAR